MAKVDTFVIGASAGGVEALSRLVRLLPGDLPASVLIVIHFPQTKTSLLPTILNRYGTIPAAHAMDGEILELSRIYVGPPGAHMLLNGDTISVVLGPKENGNRPAIDPLFRTAAHSRTSRVVGVLLSGLLDDGTLGLSAIRRQGGVTIVQDPEEALFGHLSRSAIEAGVVDMILPLDLIAAKLIALAGEECSNSLEEQITDPVNMDLISLSDLEKSGQPSAYVCPECGGTLYELKEEEINHFRCRVGHSYLAESLSANQEENVEAAVWVAIRAIKEHNDLLDKMMKSSEERGLDYSAERFRARLKDGQSRLDLLTRVFGDSPNQPSR